MDAKQNNMTTPSNLIPRIGASLWYNYADSTWNVKSGMDGEILHAGLSKTEAVKKAAAFNRSQSRAK